MEAAQIDYSDVFTLPIENSIAEKRIQDFGKAFFTSAPKWVAGMMAFRDRVMGVLGAKTSAPKGDRQALLDAFTCEKDQELGLFKVYESTEDLVVLGQDDSHLDFRIHMYLDREAYEFSLKTTVKFNNVFGKLYFLPVKPFHKLIVPRMMMGIIQEVQKN